MPAGAGQKHFVERQHKHIGSSRSGQVVQWQLLIVFPHMQASLNNDNTKPSYWLHEAVLRSSCRPEGM
jgi:hypothetical protein